MTAENPSTQSHKPGNKNGLLTFILLLVLIALSGNGYLHWQNLQQPVAPPDTTQLRQVLVAQNQVAEAFKASMLDQLSGMQAGFNAALNKQNQMMDVWVEQLNNRIEAALKTPANPEYEKNHATRQATYLLQAANLNLLLVDQKKHAISYLKQADALLSPWQDARLLQVRRQLASDILVLQDQSSSDITQHYFTLTALSNELEQLPLHLNWMTNQQKKASIEDQNLHPIAQKLLTLVRVRTQADPLPRPAQIVQLARQHLRIILGQAQAALLSQQQAIYTDALTRAKALLEIYFDENHAQVFALSSQLTQLAKVQIVAPLPDINSALLQLEQSLQQDSKLKL